MKGVPPEIDDLLWRLAEEGGPLARAEFEARHARYGPELARRIRMVSELREAGKTLVRRPKFSPRPVKVSPVPRWATGTAAALASFAVGAVAYVVASSGERPSVVDQRPPQKQMVTPPPLHPSSPGPLLPHKKAGTPPAPIEQAAPEQTPSYRLPRDVQIEDTSLTAAIQLVAAGGGLKATIAPGFEDRKVTLNYRGLDTIATLETMGQEYGFSVIEESEGEFLVLPVRESSSIRRIGP